MKAWVENNVVRDIASVEAVLLMVPQLAALFNTDIPDDVVRGATLVSGVWSNPIPVVQEEPEPVPLTLVRVSPIEFKLLFTFQERVAIKEERANDPIIDDFFEIVEDPRLTHVNLALESTKMAIQYLASKNLIAPERVEQILSGNFI